MNEPDENWHDATRVAIGRTEGDNLETLHGIMAAHWWIGAHELLPRSCSDC